MKQKSNIADNIRCYYFENILPHMIYSGNLLEQKSFLDKLRFNGEDFINFTYNFLCQDIMCLSLDTEYKFKVNIIKKVYLISYKLFSRHITLKLMMY